jgi:hypothetical protein
MRHHRELRERRSISMRHHCRDNTGAEGRWAFSFCVFALEED